MNGKRWLILIVLVLAVAVLVVGGAGSALASGPSGSANGQGAVAVSGLARTIDGWCWGTSGFGQTDGSYAGRGMMGGWWGAHLTR